MIKFSESGHPLFRSASPLSRGVPKSKGGGTLSMHFYANGKRLKLFFAQLFLLISSVFTEQSQICVKNTGPVKQERGDPCWQDNLTFWSGQEVCWWQYLHFRLKFLAQFFCISRDFHNKIEWSRFALMQDSWKQLKSDSTSWQSTPDEFSQFSEPVTCREYTLPRDENLTDPKGWIRGNTRIGHVFEVTTSYLQGKYGVEFRNESVNKDNSHSWVRISHGLNKLVTDLIDKEYDNNEQETSEMQFENFALTTNVIAFASRSKAQAKPRRRNSCLLIYKNCTYLWKILDWCWARNLFEYRFPSVKKWTLFFGVIFGTSLRSPSLNVEE